MTKPETPALRVLRGGTPTEEELAALLAALATRAAATSGRQRSLREPLSPWVASGRVNGTRTRA